jgi:hypothetical protein
MKNLNGNNEEDNVNYAEKKLLSFLIDSITRVEIKIDSFKENIDHKFETIDIKMDSIRGNMITQEDCEKNQNLCAKEYKVKKISAAKITAVGGILAVITGFIISMIKIFK